MFHLFSRITSFLESSPLSFSLDVNVRLNGFQDYQGPAREFQPPVDGGVPGDPLQTDALSYLP